MSNKQWKGSEEATWQRKASKAAKAKAGNKKFSQRDLDRALRG